MTEARNDRPLLRSHPDGSCDVEVPVFRDGRRLTSVVPFTYDYRRDVFTVEVSGELLDQHPEGLTAAVQIGVRTIAEARRGGSDG